MGFVGEYFEIPAGTYHAVIDAGDLGVVFRFSVGPDGVRLADGFTALEGCAGAPAAPRRRWRVRARPDPQYSGVAVIAVDEPAPADDRACLSAAAGAQPLARFASLADGTFAAGPAPSAKPAKAARLVYEILVRSLPKGAPVLVGERTVGLTELRLAIPYRLDRQGNPVQNDHIFIRMRQGPSCRLAARQAIVDGLENIVCEQRQPGPARQRPQN